jgi:hypothetical protein
MYTPRQVNYLLFLSGFHKNRFSKNSQILIFMNPSGGNRVVPCGQMDGRTDGRRKMTKLTVTFRSLGHVQVHWPCAWILHLEGVYGAWKWSSTHTLLQSTRTPVALRTPITKEAVQPLRRPGHTDKKGLSCFDPESNPGPIFLDGKSLIGYSASCLFVTLVSYFDNQLVK